MKEGLPTGPCHIAGYSFGACIAFEMCLQLESAGDPVGSISLLDGSHSYVAAHTGHYKSKLTPGDTAREESEALCAFTLQFTAVDYVKVNIQGESRIPCRRGRQHIDPPLMSQHFGIPWKPRNVSLYQVKYYPRNHNK